MEKIDIIFEKNLDLSLFEPYKIECEKCCGLCCVALYFTKSDGFPKDKKAGAACENLQNDYRCKIYPELATQGLKGCMTYDCFGAGQFITRHLQSRPIWPTISPKEAARILDSYLVVLKVHQTLWYLSQCLMLCLPLSEKEATRSLITEGSSLIEQPFERLSVLDMQPFCEKSNVYLRGIGAIYQTGVRNVNKTQVNNYMGKNMQRKNLTGIDFSMSLLIAANLVQANLYGANFLGADMRDTNICDTDLSKCLFLTQLQINSSKGNSNTILPPYLHQPKAWGFN